MKRGWRVVKIMNVCGVETATLWTVASVRRGVVKIVDDEGHVSPLEFDVFGNEIAPTLPGCSNRLVKLES